MKKIYKTKIIGLIAMQCLLCFISCKKDFLEKKPNTGIVIPTTIEDMTHLLDNNSIMNYTTPAIGFVSGEEAYFGSLENFNSIQTKTEKNAYIWNKEIYAGELEIADWNKPYRVVFYANAVLQQWDKLSENEKNSINGKFVKAWALFERSLAFYNLVQLFSSSYDASTANINLGIPLKLEPNINTIYQRSTVKETYDQIISDLQSSISLYTNDFPTRNRNRSSKAATYALLGRIFLSMRDYENAFKASVNSLSLYDKLIDYNTLSLTSSRPMGSFHDELLLMKNVVIGYFTPGFGTSSVNPDLVKLYENNDLRKQIFFNKVGEVYYMKRAYVPSGGYAFTGLAVDEVYLIKAECQVRKGDTQGALNTLNVLLETRYVSATFVPFHSSNSQEVLDKILLERRKELVWRGLRWSDLKRLNLEGANITLSRNVGENRYLLPPNDPRYVLPIPDDEISLSNIEQNIR